ncbi:DUF6718 family protein [Clostridium thermobutyricum]|uniref:DUF6718 family protein n=1 Tax=Clostridium thermobutyricum TaxID=29372 RepID=UPI0018A9CE6F|nr:DUF6718 family protein [Clostridium thermobutyricum]
MKTIIIKEKDSIGSYGYNSNNLSYLISLLDSETIGTTVQLVTVNNIQDYKEYEPVKYMNTLDEFLCKFEELIKNSTKLNCTDFILNNAKKYADILKLNGEKLSSDYEKIISAKN